MHLVDFFKRAGNGANGVWLTQTTGVWNTQEQNKLDLDADGWPRSLPAANSTAATYRSVATIIWMNSSKLPSGRWTVLFDGEGSLAYGMSGVTRNAAASTIGRDAVDVAAGSTGFTISITATDPNRTGNYIRNIRAIPPGGTCNNDKFTYALDASACPSTFRPFTETYLTQPFHPQFLSDLRPFAALRFMQFFSTNLDQTTQWSQRSKLTDTSWGYTATRGAPIEVAVDLSNALDASPWLALPAMIDDDYVTQYARLVKARLTTTRPVYVEYGNEVWNGAYPYSIAALWVQAQGKARWSTSRESDYAKQMNWFGMRTKQVCAIWKQVFSERASQVKCVMGAQGAGSYATDHYELSCPLHAAELGGTTCDAKGGIDAFAVGFYFGGHISDTSLQSAVESQWFTQADGGLTGLFQEITDGTGLTTPPNWTRARASVAGIATQMAQNKAIADKYGIEMLVYEGGNELTGGGSNAYQTKLQTLFETAQRDPRMATAYATVLANWKANGGHLYTVFESTGAYSAVRGNSTLLEWTGQPRSQALKYDAVLRFIEGNPCWWTSCALSVAVQRPAMNMAVGAGWNLLGTGSTEPLVVSDINLFGDAAKVQSVWKWLNSSGRWAFYSPTLTTSELGSYVTSHGYDLLTSIDAGEGFWVHAKTAFSVSLPSATAATSSSVQAGLKSGWNLVSVGETKNASDFAATTLWAWDNAQSKWYFYAPSLDAQGGTSLSDYISSNGHLNFSSTSKTLGPGVGFWINKP